MVDMALPAMCSIGRRDASHPRRLKRFGRFVHYYLMARRRHSLEKFGVEVPVFADRTRNF